MTFKVFSLGCKVNSYECASLASLLIKKGYEENNDKVAFEGNNVVKDVTLYIPAVTYNMCAKIYHNGETAYDEAANVTVNNVNVVIAQ